MALNKIMNLHNNDWGYHRILNVDMDILNGRCLVDVAAYKDRNHRLNNERDFVKKIKFNIPFSDIDGEKLTNALSELYRCLKLSKLDDENNETSFFVDAVDELE